MDLVVVLLLPFYVRGIKRFIQNTAEVMKYSKPRYDTKQQIYYVDIQDGIRFRMECEGGKSNVSLESLFHEQMNSIVQETIQLTQGWFSKPLTPDYLRPRLACQYPTQNLESYDGTLEFALTALIITKQAFTFEIKLINYTPTERLVIDLPEDEQKEDVELPVEDSGEPALTVGPTRRRMVKLHVMRARARAARALYKAEQLTQAYCEAYGDDTDWDEDDSSAEDEEEEREDLEEAL